MRNSTRVQRLRLQYLFFGDPSGVTVSKRASRSLPVDIPWIVNGSVAPPLVEPIVLPIKAVGIAALLMDKEQNLTGPARCRGGKLYCVWFCALIAKVLVDRVADSKPCRQSAGIGDTRRPGSLIRPCNLSSAIITRDIHVGRAVEQAYPPCVS